jgi:hypothetical protein
LRSQFESTGGQHLAEEHYVWSQSIAAGKTYGWSFAFSWYLEASAT